MDFFGWLMFGVLVAVLARVIMPKSTSGHSVSSLVLGITGGVVGGWLASSTGFYDGPAPVGFLLIVVLAIVILRSTIRLAHRLLGGFLAHVLDVVLARQSAPFGRGTVR